MKLSFLILSFALSITNSYADEISPDKMVRVADSLMQYGVNYPMIPGGVFALVDPDSVYLLKGYGFGNVANQEPVDIHTTLFQLGSVGKVFTAMAVLQQVEAGQLDLHSDVNTYLEGWQIENEFSNPVTLMNLLTHSAGFNERVIGYLSRSESELMPLEDHLRINMPTRFQEPGRNINYSNYSYALAGHLVELAANESFVDYIRNNILYPSGMKYTTYYLPDNYEDYTKTDSLGKITYATGYQWRETFNEVNSYPRHATPAGSIISTGADMAIFMQSLLKKDTMLLGNESYKYLFQQQFTNHPMLTGYSLGMEVQNINGYPAIGKGGNIPGFISIMLLFPEDNLGLFVSVNTQTDNFLELFFDTFLNQFFPVQVITKPVEVEFDPDDYTGVYLSERTNHETIEEMFALFEGDFSIWKSEAGNLACFHNGKNHEYLPYKRDIFQNSESPHQFLVFSREESGKIENMYRSVVLGGIQVPATYRKANWFERPRFLNDEYPYALLVLISYLILPFAWLITAVIRRKRKDFLIQTKIPWIYHGATLLFLALFFINIFGFWVPLLQNREELLFEFSPELLSMRYFNYAMAITVIALVFLSITLWMRKAGNLWIRIYYSMFSLISISYVLILYRWHFLSIVIK